MNKQEIINFIASEEGFRSKVYLDIAGKRTIGFGHLCTNSTPNKISYQDALKLLSDDIDVTICQIKAWLVENSLSGDDLLYLKDYEITALVSLVFNIGINKFGGYMISSMFLIYIYSIKIHVPDVVLRAEISSKFKQYCHVGKKRVEGLFNRRCRESCKFLYNK